VERAYCDPAKDVVVLPNIDSPEAKQVLQAHKNLLTLLSINVDQEDPGKVELWDWFADFDHMVLKTHQSLASTQFALRRLCTPSKHGSDDQWATKWIWYLFVSEENQPLLSPMSNALKT
jgi:hypothetical protein